MISSLGLYKASNNRGEGGRVKERQITTLVLYDGFCKSPIINSIHTFHEYNVVW